MTWKFWTWFRSKPEVEQEIPAAKVAETVNRSSMNASAEQRGARDFSSFGHPHSTLPPHTIPSHAEVRRQRCLRLLRDEEEAEDRQRRRSSFIPDVITDYALNSLLNGPATSGDDSVSSPAADNSASFSGGESGGGGGGSSWGDSSSSSSDSGSSDSGGGDSGGGDGGGGGGD